MGILTGLLGVAGPCSATLDKIVPELGYIQGNIQLASKLANEMKSNATTAELQLFAKYIATTYGDN